MLQLTKRIVCLIRGLPISFVFCICPKTLPTWTNKSRLRRNLHIEMKMSNVKAKRVLLWPSTKSPSELLYALSNLDEGGPFTWLEPPAWIHDGGVDLQRTGRGLRQSHALLQISQQHLLVNTVLLQRGQLWVLTEREHLVQRHAIGPHVRSWRELAVSKRLRRIPDRYNVLYSFYH